MKMLGLGSMLVSMMGQFAIVMGGAPIDDAVNTIVPLKRAKSEGPNKTKRIRTGKTYPHSNTRQRARYARQIAAGQITVS